MLYAVVYEFTRFTYHNLGIAIGKALGGRYVIEYGLAPVSKALGVVTSAVKGWGEQTLRFVMLEQKFNSMLHSFKESPRGYQFLVNDMLDGAILMGRWQNCSYWL